MGLTASANRVIARYGRAAKLLRETVTGGDEWDPETTTAEHDVTVALVDFTADERSGTVIAETDRKAILSVAGLTIDPKPSDRLQVDGVTYVVAAVHKVESGGSVHAWTLRVKA
ncbi:MAG: hypothetical protein CMJ42_11615 [Phyllobacteriaceae bacterium]|mgnify:CR=1 FL=1|nr:hypothetical protein [Phyllobacteriaceae bacterium]MBA90637.1 hypothetical protein [Phyllobacteriaceae bacterium]